MSSLILILLLAVAPAIVSDLAFADSDMTRPEVEQLARQYADLYGVPQGIVLRTVKRESTFRPSARNGPYWGLMQIRYDTAKSMGYVGPPQGLLDAATNLNYGVAYLANAYMIAGGNESMTHRLYRSGYYYAAKRQKLLAKLIKAAPLGSQPVMVARFMPKAAPADDADAGPVVVAAAAPDPVPLPHPKPAIVVAAADAEVAVSKTAEPEPAEVAAAPLPVAKPQIARPQVVLASVLPEPHLSLSFGRDTPPANGAALALADAPVAASGADLAIRSSADTGPDFTAAYFDIPVKVLPQMPLPRPRPTGTAAAEAAAAAPPTLVAAVATPRPKPRPVE